VADINIAGSASVENAGSGTVMESDLVVTGTSGDSALVAAIALDGSIAVEELYLTTSVAGIAIKAGTWLSADSELSQDAEKTAYSASTSFGGFDLTYENVDDSTVGANDGGNSIAISGELSGISMSHEVGDTWSETIASASMGGVDASVHMTDKDGSGTNRAVTLSTEIEGMTLTYVDVSTDYATSMDGYIGEYSGVTSANAFGISTILAGNTVELKQVDVTGTDVGGTGIDSVDQTEITVTRDLGNGTTLEASYNDTDNKIGLELSVDF
jgi:hypothetical protein